MTDQEFLDRLEAAQIELQQLEERSREYHNPVLTMRLRMASNCVQVGMVQCFEDVENLDILALITQYKEFLKDAEVKF